MTKLDIYEKLLNGGAGAIPELLEKLKQDIMDEENKRAGNGNIARSMKRIIKNSSIEGFKGAFIQGGKQIVCDGYRAIAVNEPIEIESVKDVEIMDIMKVIENTKNDADKTIDLPTVGELKIIVSAETGEYDFGEGKPLVNASYLLDIITAFPDATARFSEVNKPIYFKGEKGEAILLPRSRPKNRA